MKTPLKLFVNKEPGTPLSKPGSLRRSNGVNDIPYTRRIAHNFVDMTGQRVGRLVAIEYAETKNKTAQWWCKCDCGNYTTVQGTLLNKGKIISCGCFRKEQAKNAQRKDFDKDLLGKKIGKLTVIEYLGNDLWKCKCECGNYTTKKRSYLLSHKNDKEYSCGCSRKKIDTSFIGRRFGRFTVISYVGNGKWLCRCDCGNVTAVEKSKLLSGKSKSCGCQRDEERTIGITDKIFLCNYFIPTITSELPIKPLS